MRGLYLVAPFVSTLAQTRFSLGDLRRKIERECIPTYIVTREPSELYQKEAIEILMGSPWIEIRYNDLIHAKVYIAYTEREADSFALFGSGNLTAKSIESNIELGMMVYSEGPGREILRELLYWAGVRVRTSAGSELIQAIRVKRS